MSERLSDVGYLGFDVFGTVVDWRSSVARQAQPFLRKYRIDIDPFAFADAWRAEYQPSMQAVRSGARPWTKLDILNRENLEAILASHAVERAGIADADLADLNRAWERLDPWPDSLEGLTRLKRRFAIGPVSNGHIAGMLNLARFGGLPWDVITGAELAQTYKPMPAVYLRTADAVGLEPGRVAMVAAHNDDLHAARAVGLRTAFVLRAGEHGAGQVTDLAPDGDWDIVATSLVDLAEQLGC